MAGGEPLHLDAAMRVKEATHADAASKARVKGAERLLSTLVLAAGHVALARQEDMSIHGMVVQSDLGRQVELRDRTFALSGVDAVQARPGARRTRMPQRRRKQRRPSCT